MYRKLFVITVFFLSLIFTGCQHKSSSDFIPKKISEANIRLALSLPTETTLASHGTEDPQSLWLKMISSAKSSIDIGQFYLANKEGEPLEDVILELISAAKRGVKIRILTDIVMLDGVSKATVERLRPVDNIEIRVFDWKNLTGGIIHAKYFVIDKKITFIGSQNFDWRALKHIHETGIYIDDANLTRAVSYIFEMDWNWAGGVKTAYKLAKKSPLFKFHPAAVLTASPAEYSPRGVTPSIIKLLELIHNAKEKITVQILTYSLKKRSGNKIYNEIDNALREAAKRGVKIKMLIADWSKRKPAIDHIKELSKVNNIEIKLVTIPEASEGFIPYSRVIHSKVMRVDDEISWISTSNWEYSYFYNSRNLSVVLQYKNIATTLDKLFDDLWDSSYAYMVNPSIDYTPPVRDK